LLGGLEEEGCVRLSYRGSEIFKLRHCCEHDIVFHRCECDDCISTPTVCCHTQQPTQRHRAPKQFQFRHRQNR